MKKITESILSLICSASILSGCSNGCVTTITPRNYPIIKHEIKITEENEIYRYFTEDFKEKKSLPEKISKSLEGIVEKDMSDIFFTGKIRDFGDFFR